MINRCKWFKLYELLPPELYKNEEQGWDYFDARLLRSIDAIRDILNVPLICNNWYHKGKRKASGYRLQSSSIGAQFSAHKQGMAADLISTRMTAEQMRQILILNADKLPYPIRIEKDVTWLHVDVRCSGKQKITMFNG
jgi:Peptidase M15.